MNRFEGLQALQRVMAEMVRLEKLVKAQDGLIRAKNELLLCYRMGRVCTDTLFEDIQKWTNKVNKCRGK